MLNIHEQKLFIVDDEELILSATHRRLTKLGFEDVTAFSNGTDCVNALIEEPFLILLDYEMDGLSGFEVLRKIKRYNPNTYVIFMSGQDDISNAVDTLKYGAFDYIIKGDDDVDKLMLAIERIYKIEERILAPRKSVFSKILSIT
jgi:DNA-binding NtrC family response regulator